MKLTTLVLILSLTFAATAQLQVGAHKVVLNTTAGNLSVALGKNLTTCTDLKLSGWIDKRDFKTMRDSMLSLEFIDLQEVQIASDTTNSGSFNEEIRANELPADAFKKCVKLKSIKLSKSVTGIGEFAFSGCTALNSIELPNTLSSIDAYAFEGCAALNSIVLPKFLNRIGGSAFYGSSAYINVDLDNQFYSSENGVLFDKSLTRIISCPISKNGNYFIPSSVINIGANAFNYCSSIDSIFIPSAVAKIGRDAFYGFTGLIKVDLKNTNYSSVGGVLFNKSQTILIACPTIIKGEYIILNSVTEIANAAFYNCNKLTSVVIPSTVCSIDRYSFSSCSGYFIVDSANSSYSSYNGVLYNKTKDRLLFCPTKNMDTLCIPESLKEIEITGIEECNIKFRVSSENKYFSCNNDVLFRYGMGKYDYEINTIIACSKSKSGEYNIPEGVVHINKKAFFKCNNITSISIPSTARSIGDYAFYNCSGLKVIISKINSLEDVSIWSSSFENIDMDKCILYVPIGTKKQYQNSEVWKNFKNIYEKEM